MSEDAAQEQPESTKPGGRWLVVAAFLALGFTTSIMNALNDTPGATQAYLPLVFTFVGGFTLTYAGLAKEAPGNKWSAIELASVAILALCVGMLLGVPAGVGARIWGTHPPLNSGSSPGTAPDFRLHAGNPCLPAVKVLANSRPWLVGTEQGRMVATQYEVLLERLGCIQP